MIFLLFFELRLGAIVQGFGSLRFLALAWGANFLIVPFIGFAIATLFLSGQPLLFAGLVIYFISPCTDWFLGFTRMARGDTALGTALIPINMLTQLLLFPLWLWLFTRHTGLVDFSAIPGTAALWFLLPLVAAQSVRFTLEKLLPESGFERLLRWVGCIVPLAIAAFILQLFAANIGAIAGHLEVFATILLAICLFFAMTFLMGEGLSRLAGLAYPQHALLAMTTAARNAPLMLAVTAVAIPNQPLILAVLVIGMLVEFPHLTGLKQLLLWQRSRQKGEPA
ncbi:MAG: arsenic resistance protein [Pseudomonadota bacterium]